MTRPQKSAREQPCGWCHGEGALRDAEGKLGEDCPRCRGVSILKSSATVVRSDADTRGQGGPNHPDPEPRTYLMGGTDA